MVVGIIKISSSSSSAIPAGITAAATLPLRSAAGVHPVPVVVVVVVGVARAAVAAGRCGGWHLHQLAICLALDKPMHVAITSIVPHTLCLQLKCITVCRLLPVVAGMPLGLPTAITSMTTVGTSDIGPCFLLGLAPVSNAV
jgi:hypothetical protein